MTRDFLRIEVHSNFTNTVKRVYCFTLDDMPSEAPVPGTYGLPGNPLLPPSSPRTASTFRLILAGVLFKVHVLKVRVRANNPRDGGRRHTACFIVRKSA